MTDEHFRRLFQYNHQANVKVLVALQLAAPAPPPAERLFAHILAAESVWLTRLRRQDSSHLEIFPHDSLADCEKKVGELRRGWEQFLADIATDGFRGVIEYRTSKGVPHQTAVSDILTHVVNHGSYHRGQIALLLRQSGAEPPVSDYILFARQGS